MVVVEKLSKGAHFIPVKTTYKVANIADIFMKGIFRLHGISKVIISLKDPIPTPTPHHTHLLVPIQLTPYSLSHTHNY